MSSTEEDRLNSANEQLFGLSALAGEPRYDGQVWLEGARASKLIYRSTLGPLLDYLGPDAKPARNSSVPIDPGCVKTHLGI